jgi:SAM-dependent methyltransferase
MVMKEWFEDWFDTDYYDALYKQRNEQEADLFVERLVQALQIKKDTRILDVACGNGRHAIALNALGYDVTGIDLSFHKIEEVLPFQNERLHFYRHDMRHTFRINYFDCVFNFFTSFGYFESHNDEKKVASGMSANLKWNGYLIIDYLNAEFVKRNMIAREELKVGNYEFIIEKKLELDRISKKITVIEKDKCSVFNEKVRMYSLNQMVDLFSSYNLALENKFGSYRLDPYHEDQSERMILIFRKHSNKHVAIH